MTVAEVKALFTDPEKLLRRCYLHIAGGATRTATLPLLPLPPANGQAQVATFAISIADNKNVTGFTTGWAGFHGETKARAFVRLTKQPGAAKAMLADDEFNAYYVPMVQTVDVTGGTSHYTLPTRGEPTIMITSKLSGCRFGVGSNAEGALLVSHVQPNANLQPASRQSNLEAHVASGFSGRVRAFAIGDTYADMATVVGRRAGKRWHFYQQASRQGANPNDYSIDSVSVI